MYCRGGTRPHDTGRNLSWKRTGFRVRLLVGRSGKVCSQYLSLHNLSYARFRNHAKSCAFLSGCGKMGLPAPQFGRTQGPVYGSITFSFLVVWQGPRVNGWILWNGRHGHSIQACFPTIFQPQRPCGGSSNAMPDPSCAAFCVPSSLSKPRKKLRFSVRVR